MSKEYFVDQISNLSVQGSVICIDLGRRLPPQKEGELGELEKRLTVTMTGQNFVNFVKALNGTVKAISERHKEKQEANQTP